MMTVACLLCSNGCHSAQTRSNSVPVREAAPTEVAEDFVRDAQWQVRTAVVSVDPGNALTQRRSESTFSARTSRASVESHTSSLLVQVAALNHAVSMKQPLVEQQLRDLGLNVVGLKRSRLHAPNRYNVLVEDVTYVEELERKNAWDPTTYTITPAVHVRVISANERATLEAPAISVKLYGGGLTAGTADAYGRKLALARAELGRQLATWLVPRIQTPPGNSAIVPSAAASQDPGPRRTSTREGKAAAASNAHLASAAAH